jgi:hypothetical protein
VSAQFTKGVTPPVDLLKAWIDESYRAQAPKKLVAQLQTNAVEKSTRNAGVRFSIAGQGGTRARPLRRPRLRSS